MAHTTTASSWERALHDPGLRDLPYKIETNEYDQLVLSPHSYRHGRAQSILLRLLEEHVGHAGVTAVDVPVQTAKGVKVPDVVWTSAEREATFPGDATPLPTAPEICVEVLSDANTDAEMEAKRALYFACDAVEVWTCDVDGAMTVYDADGPRERSTLAPSFPAEIER